MDNERLDPTRDNISHDTPSPSTVRVSPSGSSKRKSKPVKRAVDTTETSVVLEYPMQVTSDGPPTPSIEEKPETVDGVVTAVAGEMDQTEMMRRFAEMLAANQTIQQTPTNTVPNAFQTLLAAAAAGCAFDTTALSPNSMFPTDALSTDGFLQAILSSSMNGFVNTSPTTVATQLSLLQGFVGGSNADRLNSTTPPTSITPLAQSKGPVKRKLFDGNKDLMSQAASTITKEERIDLDDLENFAQMFKKQRIKFGFTQGDVGVALGRRYGTDFSQTTISRFEALNLSFKNMCKLRPLLKEWLNDAETAVANGASLNDLFDKPSAPKVSLPVPVEASVLSTTVSAPAAISPSRQCEPSVKRRRKRTNLDMSQRTTLDAFFAMNPRPDHDRMTEIANSLELERDVVRVWFCNRRQKMRRADEPDTENALLSTIKAFTESHSHLSTETDEGNTSTAST